VSFNNFLRKMTLICRQRWPFSENFWAVNSLVERTDLADHLEHFIRFEGFSSVLLLPSDRAMLSEKQYCVRPSSLVMPRKLPRRGGKVNSCPTKVNLYSAELTFVIFEMKTKLSALWVIRNCNKIFLTILILGIR